MGSRVGVQLGSSWVFWVQLGLSKSKIKRILGLFESFSASWRLKGFSVLFIVAIDRIMESFQFLLSQCVGGLQRRNLCYSFVKAQTQELIES